MYANFFKCSSSYYNQMIFHCRVNLKKKKIQNYSSFSFASQSILAISRHFHISSSILLPTTIFEKCTLPSNQYRIAVSTNQKDVVCIFHYQVFLRCLAFYFFFLIWKSVLLQSGGNLAFCCAGRGIKTDAWVGCCCWPSIARTIKNNDHHQH